MKASQLYRGKLLHLPAALQISLHPLPHQIPLVIHRQPLPWPAAMVLNEVRPLLGCLDQQHVCHCVRVRDRHKASKTKERLVGR